MTFYKTIAAAIADMATHGYDSQARLNFWLRRIRKSAIESLVSPKVLEKTLRATLGKIYKAQVERGGLATTHPGVSTYTIQNVRPALRAELSRRVAASANLIVLNRDAAIQKTEQRFSGWASSIPAGGSKAADKVDTKATVAKALKQLPFEERRVAVDQGHKFIASLNNIVAADAGAIAITWRSNFREAGYDYRPDHKRRDGKVYLLRDCLAQQKGFVKPGEAGYYDEITAVAEEPFCFPGDSKIPLAYGVEKAFRRLYSGEVVSITLASGQRLRATPNHPVLTPFGWRAIGLLNEGDDVLEAGDGLLRALEKDQDNRVATISEIFSALEKLGVSETFDLGTANFHGDLAQGNVDTVNATRPLTFGLVPALTQGSQNLRLREANGGRSMIGAAHFGLLGLEFTSPRVVRGLHIAAANLWAFLSGPYEHAFAAVSHGAASLDDVTHDDGSRDAVGRSQLLHAFAGQVFSPDSIAVQDNLVAPVKTERLSTKVNPGDLDPRVEAHVAHADDLCDLFQAGTFPAKIGNVVKVDRESFSGHVYNLQTMGGWYVTQNIITHNCRCHGVYVYALSKLPPDMLTAKGRNEIERVKAEIAKL